MWDLYKNYAEKCNNPSRFKVEFCKVIKSLSTKGQIEFFLQNF